MEPIKAKVERNHDVEALTASTDEPCAWKEITGAFEVVQINEAEVAGIPSFYVNKKMLIGGEDTMPETQMQPNFLAKPKYQSQPTYPGLGFGAVRDAGIAPTALQIAPSARQKFLLIVGGFPGKTPLRKHHFSAATLSGSRIKLAGVESEDSEADKVSYHIIASKSVELARTELRNKKNLRLQLARVIAAEPSPHLCIGLALSILVAESEPGRLDDAVDLLCELADHLIAFSINELRVNPPNGMNDDRWYAIIRALGKLNHRIMVQGFRHSPYRTVREAVVEALGDLGDTESLKMPSEIAQQDESPFIRQISQDIALELTE